MTSKIQIQLSVMMFLQFFIWGSWYVTMGTYLGEIGFQGSDIGEAYSTMALAAIISPLFVGMIADKFFPAERVLAVMHLLGGVFIWLASDILEPGAFFWVLLLHALCYMPTLALANAVAFQQIKNPAQEFPKIRVLGTIGWIVAGLALSFADGIIPLPNGESIEATNLPLRIGAVASIVLGIYAFTLPSTPPQSRGEKKTIGELLGLDAIKLMKNRSFAILIISSFLISIPLSFYYGFANPFLNESGMEYAAGKMTLGQVSEIVFLLLMPLFFKRLGVKKMILIGMLAWVARYVLFAYGDNQALVFMFYTAIILHGICYDFFFVTGQIYVDNKAPEGIRSSAQGFITLVTYGAGMYIGTLLAGRVVQHYEIMNDASDITGHHWFEIWMIPAILAAVVAVIFVIFFKDDTEVKEI